MSKYKAINTLLIVITLTLPFSVYDRNDEIEAVELSDSTIGYYQSTTCKISLLEFYSNNFNNNDIKIYINNNDYVDIKCFGKITGVDKVNETFFVSIGTNTSINLILQSVFWTFLLLFIPVSNAGKTKTIKYLYFLPLVFSLQILFSESRFYSRTNIHHNIDLTISNLYLVSTVLFFYVLIFFIYEILIPRLENIINYFPYIFLLVGTYTGMNLNFYLIIGSVFGILNIYKYRKILIYDVIYFLISIFWILNTIENDYFFDTDKLRGFSNSSYSISSQIYWIILIYLLVKGVVFIANESKNYFNIEKFLNNLLISSSLVVFFGIVGSNSPLFNFLNFYFFGQNKRGMKTIESIAGNTWRGFSSSAESIGEFYGLVIFSTLFCLLTKKITLNRRVILLVVPSIYGLLRSNNFAAFVSLIVITVCLVGLRSSFFKANKKNIILFIFVLLIVLSYVYGINSDYKYISTELIYEATLHQKFYFDPDPYASYLVIEEKMIERDLYTILNDVENENVASSSYKYLVKSFIPDRFNVPFIPNLVAVISIISLLINRTEMWGIFIAKHSPTLTESFLGVGPQQLNNYLYKHDVRLDVPNYKIDSLFLPHSSLLDVYIYGGILGLLLIFFLIIKSYQNSNKNLYFQLSTIFLLVNYLKSDSILYINAFLLINLYIACLFFNVRDIKNE
tara:strand:+ start:1558 stop:3594 length:2037 start_codon:yes stop_codon:yes gene_type:complete